MGGTILGMHVWYSLWSISHSHDTKEKHETFTVKRCQNNLSVSTFGPATTVGHADLL